MPEVSSNLRYTPANNPKLGCKGAFQPWLAGRVVNSTGQIWFDLIYPAYTWSEGRQTVRQVEGSHPFLAPGAAALGVQAASLWEALGPAPPGRGPTGFTAALDASILKVPLFQACVH